MCFWCLCLRHVQHTRPATFEACSTDTLFLAYSLLRKLWTFIVVVVAVVDSAVVTLFLTNSTVVVVVAGERLTRGVFLAQSPETSDRAVVLHSIREFFTVTTVLPKLAGGGKILVAWSSHAVVAGLPAVVHHVLEVEPGLTVSPGIPPTLWVEIVAIGPSRSIIANPTRCLASVPDVGVRAVSVLSPLLALLSRVETMTIVIPTLSFEFHFAVEALLTRGSAHCSHVFWL